jgi:predicted HNH restriction endonuclease
MSSRAGVWTGRLVYEDTRVVTYSDTETVDEVRRSRHERQQRRFDAFEEGFVSEILIELTHRNAGYARAVKERDGFTCVVCGFNFFTTYGERGRDFAECHHLLPFSVLRGRRASTLDEAVTVCSNCHMLFHRGHEILTPAQPQRLIPA